MQLSTGDTPTETADATERAPRRSRHAGDLRDRLLEAALVEFAAKGFDGASTRAIAARAGAHQPQINYHFDSKESLWKACLERLLGEFDDLLASATPQEPRDQLVHVIESLVTFAARRPELNRIMLHEATDESERLRWLVETQLRPRSENVLVLWDVLVERGEAGPVPRELVYHLLIGAASLMHANAPEARLLLGIEPSSPDVVRAHAAALVALLLPTQRS